MCLFNAVIFGDPNTCCTTCEDPADFKTTSLQAQVASGRVPVGLSFMPRGCSPLSQDPPFWKLDRGDELQRGMKMANALQQSLKSVSLNKMGNIRARKARIEKLELDGFCNRIIPPSSWRTARGASGYVFLNVSARLSKARLRTSWRMGMLHSEQARLLWHFASMQPRSKWCPQGTAVAQRCTGDSPQHLSGAPERRLWGEELQRLSLLFCLFALPSCRDSAFAWRRRAEK